MAHSWPSSVPALLLTLLCLSHGTWGLQLSEHSQGSERGSRHAADAAGALSHNARQNEKAMEACFGKNWRRAGEAISHCFMEHDTHNTCCMLDKKARDMNDAKGNPIGHASLVAARAIANATAAELPDAPGLLTPWCTCFGSQVCGYYARTTQTKVKFIHDCKCSPSGVSGRGFCMANISQKDIYDCEGWGRGQFAMAGHATPGVVVPPAGVRGCKPLQGKHEVDISSCA
mmetsp:Transcript_12813/g.36388  ORF Transcript_12813/g.36388 Transcript_12813/m.36388 type:complete len:230 (-) Transcript_12813:102-791(-)